MPLYRKESLFKQYGIALNRKNMANRMLKSRDQLTALYHGCGDLCSNEALFRQTRQFKYLK
ncbi:hypothetical protein SG35_000425 [Thalassomonas actiniarum]|uniref:Transposase n=1 Tax=Thalassomonas actiniarum TaxID=485447 RepID=A0AAF0C3Q6_9GAMM|nr:hypothetical protein SG35_000425 [Thalassomonas actiniarum]